MWQGWESYYLFLKVFALLEEGMVLGFGKLL